MTLQHKTMMLVPRTNYIHAGKPESRKPVEIPNCNMDFVLT